MFGDVAIRFLSSTPQPYHYNPYDQIIQQTNKLAAARVAAKDILLLGFCVFGDGAIRFLLSIPQPASHSILNQIIRQQTN